MRGNALELAVGIIIGGAFGKIVTSLVNDIAMPLISLLVGGYNVANWTAGPVHVGSFLQATIDFVLIALFVFLIIKGINIFRKKEEKKEQEQQASKEETLLGEIRDLLKSAVGKSENSQ